MTTEQPYSGDFSVPPGTAAAVTEDMLPPIPPRPMPVTVASVLLGLFALAVVGGNAWEVYVELTTPAPDGIDRGTGQVLLPLLLMLLLGTGAVVLLRLVWLGSKIGSILTMVLAGYMTLTLGFVAVGLVDALFEGELTQRVSDRYRDDPGAAGVGIAYLTCLPILILLAVPPSWRWSRKAGMIRQIRALIRKGRPVTRLPQQIFD